MCARARVRISSELQTKERYVHPFGIFYGYYLQDNIYVRVRVYE